MFRNASIYMFYIHTNDTIYFTKQNSYNYFNETFIMK